MTTVPLDKYDKGILIESPGRITAGWGFRIRLGRHLIRISRTLDLSTEMLGLAQWLALGVTFYT